MIPYILILYYKRVCDTHTHTRNYMSPLKHESVEGQVLTYGVVVVQK